MKSYSNRGISNKGAPFTAGIPCPSACLEDVKTDTRYNRQPDFSESSNSARSCRTSRTSSSRSTPATRVTALLMNETSYSDEGEVMDIIEDNEATNVENDTDAHQQKKSRGRPFVPKNDSFMCDPTNIVEVVMEVHKHARQCGGNLKHCSRSDTHYHGLCIEMKFQCTNGNRCSYWKEGIYAYHSQTPILASSFLASHDIEIPVNKKYPLNSE
eukprot:CAMPEP_0119037490 /NCGR_PEP_ID=MMETSP1177-20130426/5875_1 /TAXON_ID=2985 /ORGANISM="Ochromonas sp, Strain CCMP1899" /LENGTH=212 /DNA_ID=CAMNT_0006998825 /DNA_START=297 /DNA_END=935 /DNA_ORIENTATION=+